MSAMVLVLSIPELHCVFIKPGPDMMLDIQGWSGYERDGV